MGCEGCEGCNCNGGAMAAEHYPKDSVVDQLFDHDEWDSPEEGVYVFSPITLKVDVPSGWICALHRCPTDFNAGKTFSHACVNFTQATITFYDKSDDEVGHKFKLQLTVGEKLL